MLASRATRATLVSRSRGARLAGLYWGGRRVLNAPGAYGNWASVPADGLLLASVGKGAYTVELLFTGAGSLHIAAATDAPLTLNQAISTVEFLAVGSGGTGANGGNYGGGGGGGKVVAGTAALSAGNFTISVGGPTGSGTQAAGNPTTISGGLALVAAGGNAGNGLTGGTSGNGFAGGTGTNGSGPGGGGGGGATGAGMNGGGSAGGTGGLGITSPITGVAVGYGGGGGGAGSTTRGAGQSGGGEGGRNASGQINGMSGTPNTGGGGGGAVNALGAGGGSGVVILAYPSTQPDLTVGPGLTFTKDTVARPGFKVYRFTAYADHVAVPVCTYTGGTHIYRGTVLAGGANVFGTGPITVYKGATLNRNGFTLPNVITNNGGTVI